MHASAGVDESTFFADATLRRAFIRSLEVIGEATKRLPPEFRAAHRGVDWRGVPARTRTQGTPRNVMRTMAERVLPAESVAVSVTVWVMPASKSEYRRASTWVPVPSSAG